VGIEPKAPGAAGDVFIEPGHYYSPEVARLEAERVFPKVWLIVCREQELARPGDYVVHDIGRESFFVVRTESGIKGFYNVCQHRGRRLKDGVGNSGKSIFCPFHAWRWDLEGGLLERADESDWANEPLCSASDVALKEVRLETWAGWVWATMDPDIKPLLEYLGPIPDILAPLELETCKIAWHKILHFPCNWKLVLDAFNEGYHTLGTHSQMQRFGTPKTFSGAMGDHAWFTYAPDIGALATASDTGSIDLRQLLVDQITETLATLKCLVSEYGLEAAKRLFDVLPADAGPAEVFPKFFELHRQVLEESGAKWPEHLTLETAATIATDYHIFPNTICLPCPDGAQWYRCRPDPSDPEKCVFEVWWLMRFAPGQEPPIQHDEYQTLEAFRGQNPFLEQDFSNLLASQRGVHSRGFQGMRTCAAQEMPIRNFHRVLDKYLQATD